MKKSYKHLGQVIKEFRVKADLTQKDLAEKLGYSIPQFISLMENGHSKIPLNILGELISFLKIPEKMVLDILLETYKKEAREQISTGRKKSCKSIMMKPVSAQPNSNVCLDLNSEYCSLFREASNQIAELGASVNIKITPFHKKSLEHFSKLETEQKRAVLNSLLVYLNVYRAVQAEGSSLLDSVRVVWNALTLLGFRPTSDLFSFIQPGNVIEIHDKRLVQVFRNLIFFNFCSYSLEELYCYNLQQLYTRDLEFENGLMTYVHQIYGGHTSVIKTDLKTHTITELLSTKKLKISDDIHYLAPLFSSSGGNDPVATLCIESARIESQAKIADDASPPANLEVLNNVLQFTKPIFSSEERSLL